MVLAVMVCVLVYRVYGVIQPPVSDEKPLPRPPGDVPPPGSIGDPPTEPPLLRPEDWSSIHERSMFVYKPTGQQAAGGSSAEDEIVFRVLDIQEPTQGQFVARVQTQGRPRTIRVGEKFEQFELISIDPDTQCCEIFVEALGKPIIRCIEEEVEKSP